jgi:hypothetical protein
MKKKEKFFDRRLVSQRSENRISCKTNPKPTPVSTLSSKIGKSKSRAGKDNKLTWTALHDQTALCYNLNDATPTDSTAHTAMSQSAMSCASSLKNMTMTMDN